MSELKVEIGPGNAKIDSSWITIGPYKADHVDFVIDWGKEVLPFADNSVDLVYASHVLEHIWWYDTEFALREVYRVLKLGGKLEVHVPDFALIVESYKKKRCGDAWRKHNASGNYMRWVNGRIFTYGGPGNTHRAVFDKEYLEYCLRNSGFTSIQPFAKPRGYDHGTISLSMTATKI